MKRLIITITPSILVLMLLSIAPVAWSDEAETVGIPSDELFQSTIERLKSISLTHQSDAITPALIQDIRTIFQNSSCSQSAMRQQVQGQSPIGRFSECDVTDLLQLVGELEIADVTPEVADHLAVMPTLAKSNGYNVFRERPVIQIMKNFGRDGVPLVLERMRSEAHFNDQPSYDYWACATYYLEDVFGKDTETILRTIIRDEQDIPMRERLVTLVLPHVEKFIKFELPRQARYEELKKRNPDIGKPSAQSISAREKIIAAWRNNLIHSGATQLETR